jgi:alanine dehydrogenase
MLIGVPKEIKTLENRVGLTPSSVQELVRNGHKVLVERDAGQGIRCSDGDYLEAGATIGDCASYVYDRADMIVKVKEPQPEECRMLKEGQILFTYLHLAADFRQASALMKSKCIAIAYETVTDPQGTLPLLTPMSEIAGRMSIQAGAHALEKTQGGSGLLLSGVPGVTPAKVVILGGGVVGTNAARMAVGLEADVTIIDKSIQRLRELDLQFGNKIKTIVSSSGAIEGYLEYADLVIGAVLLPGASAPKLITRDMVKYMMNGSVIVDVAIDQGGCSQTSHPTTHDHPTYIVDGVVHYCVANMPGAVPRTSTFALNNATLPYVLEIANKGFVKAVGGNCFLRQGVNVYRGGITHQAVANSLNLPHLVLTSNVLY